MQNDFLSPQANVLKHFSSVEKISSTFCRTGFSILDIFPQRPAFDRDRDSFFLTKFKSRPVRFELRQLLLRLTHGSNLFSADSFSSNVLRIEIVVWSYIQTTISMVPRFLLRHVTQVIQLFSL